MKNKSMIALTVLGTLVSASCTYAATPAQTTSNAQLSDSLQGSYQAALPFSDVDASGWAIRFITEMSTKGVISGDGNGHFRPSSTVSHEEAIVMTVKAMGLTNKAKSIDSSAALALTDRQAVSNWAKPYVAVALEHGLIDSNTALNPSASADREWVTELVVRALGWQSQAEAHQSDTLTFKDASAVDNSYAGYVSLATAQGILHGYPDQTFQPKKWVQRQEMATILCQADSLFDANQGSQTAPASDLHGTIQGLFTNGLTIATQTNQIVSYSFASNCAVFLGEQVAKISDLKGGMLVHVLLNSQGQVQFLQATPAETPAPNWAMNSTGMVTSFTPPVGTTNGSITISPSLRSQVISTEPNADQSITYSVAPNAQVYENGDVKSFGDVKPGDRVKMEIVNNTVQSIELIPAAYPRGPVSPLAE